MPLQDPGSLDPHLRGSCLLLCDTHRLGQGAFSSLCSPQGRCQGHSLAGSSAQGPRAAVKMWSGWGPTRRLSEEASASFCLWDWGWGLRLPVGWN